jgi:RNA polymerase sigma factor (TIGR02999 family)
VGDVTNLLRAANRGDRVASDRLFELTYAELKQLAHSSLRRSGGVPGLSTTMLVHDSFVRLTERGVCTPADRPAFYCYVGKVMRSVVIDAVRESRARKRGGDEEVIALTTGVAEQALGEEELLAVNDALDALESIAPELRQLVEMRYFAGLTVAEVSSAAGRSERSVERDWQKARLLLRQLIAEG